MLAMVYTEFGSRPTIERVDDPTPSASGVVLQVEASGVCRSDWHGWLGHDGDIHLPHVPGHELAGSIVEMGAKVTSWKVGDRVTVPFVAGCGICPECIHGDHQVCRNQFQPGFTAWGSFAEFVALDYADTNLVRVPPALSSTTAASLGCRFATSFRAIVDQARIKPGQILAVHGCGGIGLSAIIIGKAFGAEVVAVDVSPDALLLAERVGADHVVNVNDVDSVPLAVHELTNGGAHASIDAVGSPTTARNSVLSLRRRGKHVQIGLLSGEHARAPLPLDRVIAWELEILGSHGMPSHRYPAMLDLIADGRLNPDHLVESTVTLSEAIEHLTGFDSITEPGISVIDRFS